MADPYRNDLTTLYQRLRPLIKHPEGGGGTATPGEEMNLQRVILLDLSAAESKHYTPNAAGLTSALAVAAAGDIIILPAGTITADVALISGLEVVGFGRDRTIIAGSITGAESASLASLTVTISANSSGDVYGIIAPATGELVIDDGYPSPGTSFRVIDCDIRVDNAGSGDAFGFSTAATGALYLEQVRIEATSTGGEGWAGEYVADFCHLHGSARGSTGRYKRDY
jgi:hypothetical protein